MILSVRDRRKAQGMTQVELAAVIGVGQGTVSDWESGKKVPETANLLRLARALGCKVDDILKDDGKTADVGRFEEGAG